MAEDCGISSRVFFGKDRNNIRPFEIEEQCSSYVDALSRVLSTSSPFQGCKT